MSRAWYALGIFFTALYMLTAIFQTILQFQSGPQFFSLPSYKPWIIVTLIVYSAAFAILLKYLSHKGYRLAFLACSLAFATSVCLHYFIYNVQYLNELKNYYFTSYALVLIAGLLYNVSLIWSKAREKPLLKLAGSLSAILTIVIALIFVWFLKSHDFGMKQQLEKVHQWVSLAQILLSVLLIMNYRNEYRIIKIEAREQLIRKSGGFLIGIATIITSILTGFLGQQIARESLAQAAPQPITEKTRALAERFEARTFVSSIGDTSHYRLKKPVDYDTSRRYPLVVLLHHGGAHGIDNMIQIEGSDAPFFSNYENSRKYPAFLYVPQCPQGAGWWSPEVDLSIIENIEALENEFPIDAKRLYVMGLSGGGYGTWHFIGNHPKLFAAAIPVCGAGDPDLAPNMRDVAIWAFHGAKDDRVPVSSSRNMIRAIEKTGRNPRYTEFPNAGHNIGKEVQRTPELLDWLFAQRREKYSINR